MSETLQTTNRELLKLQEGLAALDGLADKDGSVIRFKFDPKVVWNLAKNRAIVERHVETFQRARKTIGAQTGVVERMRVTEKNAAEVSRFMEEVETILDQPVEVTGLLKIALSDLQKHENQIPPGVLSNLMPLISE